MGAIGIVNGIWMGSMWWRWLVTGGDGEGLATWPERALSDLARVSWTNGALGPHGARRAESTRSKAPMWNRTPNNSS